MKVHALTSESFSLNNLEHPTVQIESVCNHRTPAPTTAERNCGITGAFRNAELPHITRISVLPAKRPGIQEDGSFKAARLNWTNSVLWSGALCLDSESWDFCKASQGNEYHEPLPVPCRARWRLSTKLRKW